MKISIVIPTRNRSEFLRHCVQTCLASDDPDIEVIVSDNNSVDDTRSCIESIRDPRLTYVNTGRDLSMRQNFEFALDHTAGDYVIYIGDDDGIIPNGLATLRGVLGRDQPDVALWRHITYDWPRSGVSGAAAPGRLKFRCRDFCGPMKHIDPERVFQDFCRAKRVNYREGANVYHGCVHRRVIASVRDRQDGTYFNDSNPDINTAFTNLLASQSILWFRNPVTIAGAGEKSTGYAFTPRSSVSKAQKDVSRDFSKLFVEDEIKHKLNDAIRSITAHSYVNLCAIHRDWDVKKTAIDHAAWRRAVIDEVKAFEPVNRKWDVLEAFFQQVDPTYTPVGLMASDPEAMSPPPNTRPSASRPVPPSPRPARHIQPDHLLNVQAAMHWIQEVTGEPYAPSVNPTVALARQACRSIGMQRRIRAIRSRA